MRRLRAGFIGSMRAWLPSRRSVESHRGAFSIRLPGQVRSGRSMGVNGRYLWMGIAEGFCASRTWSSCFISNPSSLVGPGGRHTNLRDEDSA